MGNLIFRTGTPEDFEEVLHLNDVAVEYTAPMDMALLQQIYAGAELLDVAEEEGAVVAFVLALCKGADYESVNYRWYAENYDSFLYIDRIVVAPDQKGKGIGAKLYERVFAHAKAIGTARVTAEINIYPPNIPSMKFHNKFGFAEVGQQTLPDGVKRVSLQVAELL